MRINYTLTDFCGYQTIVSSKCLDENVPNTLLENSMESPFGRVHFAVFKRRHFFFKQYLATSNFKHIESMIVFMNMFSKKWDGLMLFENRLPKKV